MPSLNVKDEDKLYIWEAGSSIEKNDLKDVESGKGILGVHIIDLEKRIASFISHFVIAFGKLKNNPYDTMDLTQLQKKKWMKCI